MPVNIRVISATHRDLTEMVAEGRFRTDLYYRLNVVRIEIPPLRERREDIPLLVHHFLCKHAGDRTPAEGIEDAALQLLVDADWPGNVRELENVIESALALAPGPRLRVADLQVKRPQLRALVAPRSICRSPSKPTSAPPWSAHCGRTEAKRTPLPVASVSAAALSTESSPGTASSWAGVGVVRGSRSGRL